MQTLSDKIYPGKVLLFGEYTVIHGGDTLAIPLYNKFASWDYDDLEFESRNSIDQFIDFLVLNGICDLDIDNFSAEWDEGLFLDSNIPSGYGVGSSGSVVAAVYDGFVKSPVLDFVSLREVFQQMEAYFHGSSSGIDPMVSYLGKGVLLQENELHVLDIENNSILQHLYLWDSGESRKTAPLVQWYNEKIRSVSYRKQIESILQPLNSKLIDSFLQEDQAEFIPTLQEVSNFQMNNFKQMFPPIVRDGLKHLRNQYNATVKLCGAGGGGFYLIHSLDKSISEEASVSPLV